MHFYLSHGKFSSVLIQLDFKSILNESRYSFLTGTLGILSKRGREARRRHLYYGVTKSQRFVDEFCLFGFVFGLPLDAISFKLISNTIDAL